MAPPSMARIVSRCVVCFVGLIDLLPVKDLTACTTLVLWLKWSASTCFVWSGFASTCFVLKQVGFCLDPQLIPLFQAKSNGCFVSFVVVFDGTAAPLPTDLSLWDLPAHLPSVCCCSNDGFLNWFFKMWSLLSLSWFCYFCCYLVQLMCRCTTTC